MQPSELLLLLFIYYAEAAKKHLNKKASHIQYTKKKSIHRNKTIKSIKHLHITAAAKTIPKIFFDQIFRRRNEIELAVDSVFLKFLKKSQIITIEHFQPEDDSIYADKQVARQADTNSIEL